MSKLSKRVVDLKLTYAELSDLHSGLLYSKNSFVSDRKRKANISKRREYYEV